MIKVFRTIIQVEVFAPDTPYEPPFSLEGVEYDINYGNCIGTWNTLSVEEIPPQDLEAHLLRIGNDGTFFDPID